MSDAKSKEWIKSMSRNSSIEKQPTKEKQVVKTSNDAAKIEVQQNIHQFASE